MTQFKRRPIHHQTQRHIQHMLNFNEIVRRQGASCVDQVNDAPRQSERRRQFHRAREFYRLRLHAARREVPPRQTRILRRHAHLAPRHRRVARGEGGVLGDDHAAARQAEINGRVDFGIAELRQHIGAGETEVRAAERHEGRGVKRAHAHEIHAVSGGRELQPPVGFVQQSRRRKEAERLEERSRVAEDASARNREDERIRLHRRHRAAVIDDNNTAAFFVAIVIVHRRETDLIFLRAAPAGISWFGSLEPAPLTVNGAPPTNAKDDNNGGTIFVAVGDNNSGAVFVVVVIAVAPYAAASARPGRRSKLAPHARNLSSRPA